MSVIVTISGGKASAWCANWALKNYKREDVILYFNDTKWEHPDLYRFLGDLEKHFDHKITWDSDGRSPEQLFYDNNALANNRMPFCSRILKAKRLQNFYKDGDVLVFGIGINEINRAKRLVSVYQSVAAKKKKYPKLVFPLIENKTSQSQIDRFLYDSDIMEPLLYSLGFQHNNCSGGCVRAGKKHWILLLNKLPSIYLDRERVEEEMRKYTGKDIHFLKDETLIDLRKRMTGRLFKNPTGDSGECIGICDSQ